MFQNLQKTHNAVAAHTLEQMAWEGAASPAVRGVAQRLIGANLTTRPQRIDLAWRWLPTNYRADEGYDRWQPAVMTLRENSGDCEDWSVLLAAVLKALDVNASVMVMPGHAAVAVPLSDAPPLAVFFPPPDLVPLSWPTVIHRGQKYLMLETTVPPQQRRQPGAHLDRIQPWLNSDQLIIPSA